MYLKSLEIQGFKSFAEKTVLAFMPGTKASQSITAIVGPNGSGKSNVADAIRWVLGEQSMKMLRGKKSEDIIFGGSAAKGKMGFASVKMIIDNSDATLPIDQEELVIERKVYREGDGEYIINGHQVRLLDLQLLLAKAQFGQGSYSVVGQGMIDKMLLQSPAERKDFFDEAFGIKEFQIKRHQAILKLSRTKENITQAEALLNEVSPRLKSLSRQVKKLEERHEVENTLRESQESYYATLWSHNQTQLDEIQNNLKTIESDYTDSQGKLEKIQLELSDLAKESSRQEIYNELQSSFQELTQEKNALERDHAALTGKMQVEYSKAGKHNISWLENKITSLKTEQQKIEKELKQVNDHLQNLHTEIAGKKSEVEELGINKTELKSKLSSLESSLATAKSEQNFFQLTGLRAVQAILEEQNRFGRVFGAVAQLAEVAEKYQLAMDVAAGAHLSSVVVADDEVAKQGIRYLRDNQLGVATFLPISKIKPRFVPHDIDRYLAHPGVHGLATDLASFDKRFENIFSYVFGNTIIVESIDVAREIGIGRIRMVTLDGDILETSGSMKGGFRRKRTTGLSFSQAHAPHMMQGELMDHTEKIEETKRELDRTEIDYERMQDLLRDLQTNTEVELKKQQYISDQKKEIDSEIASLEQEMNLSTMSESDYSAAMKDISVQKDDLGKKINELENKILGIKNKISEFNEEEEKKKERIFALQDAMQAEQNKLNDISNKRNDGRVSLAKIETKQEDLLNEVYQELHFSIESIVKRQPPLVELEKLEELQTQIQKLKYKLSLIGGIDEEVVAEYKETAERHEGLTSQLDDLEKAMKDLEKLVVELDEIMKKRRAKGFKEIKKEFQRYFSLLFEGGKADLVEVYGVEAPASAESSGVVKEESEEDEELEDEPKKKRRKKILTGIEVNACPPGKKIKNLAALSGGERTMTSIALICAILHTNPPPFVILDEVEAALDEANTLRFTKILKELAKSSQFILITHNRATMHATDALYGVTMGNDGISHLLSVKLEQAEKVVEESK